MKVGFDYWNVCSAYPEFFRDMALMLLRGGHEVHVISAITRNRAGTVAGEIEVLGIPVTAVHEVVFKYASESPALKTARAVELGLDAFYDDRDDVCQAMTEEKILAFRVTRPGPRRADIAVEIGQAAGRGR
jgi:hypothetical protein